MTMRITTAHLEAKVATINAMLGVENPSYNVPGTIEIAGAYGGTAVHQVVNTGHGVSILTGYGTKREAGMFLDGMIAALRITQGDRR